MATECNTYKLIPPAALLRCNFQQRLQPDVEEKKRTREASDAPLPALSLRLRRQTVMVLVESPSTITSLPSVHAAEISAAGSSVTCKTHARQCAAVTRAWPPLSCLLCSWLWHGRNVASCCKELFPCGRCHHSLSQRYIDVWSPETDGLSDEWPAITTPQSRNLGMAIVPYIQLGTAQVTEPCSRLSLAPGQAVAHQCKCSEELQVSV